MTYHTLSNTDLSISRIVLGCWAFAGGSNWGDQDRTVSIRTIHAARDGGISTLDTAIGYGNGVSQQVVGEAIKGHRSEYVVLDKIPQGKARYADAIDTAETCLKNLGTDYIDLLQLHWANREVPFDETLRAAEKLKTDGKIRHFGVCNFGPKQLEAILRGTHEAGNRDAVAAEPDAPVAPEPVADVGEQIAVASNQVAYSLLFRAVELEILPQCRERGIDLLAYSPLLQGLLTGKFASADDVPEGRARTRHFSSARGQVRHGESGREGRTFAAVEAVVRIAEEAGVPPADVALAWVLAKQGFAAAICGARSAEQVATNIRAAETELSTDVIKAVDKATEDLKHALGPNADMWQGGPNSRIE